MFNFHQKNNKNNKMGAGLPAGRRGFTPTPCRFDNDNNKHGKLTDGAHLIPEYERNKKVWGFTLIELIVALGVFSLISAALAGLFVSSLRSERKALNLQLVQDNARLVMEIMTRELRDSTGNLSISTNSIQFSRVDNGNSHTISYSLGVCSENSSAQCIKRSDDFDLSIIDLGSNNVNVSSLNFYGVSSSASLNQPRVTIFFTMESGVASYQANINLQTTVSLRNIKL